MNRWSHSTLTDRAVTSRPCRWANSTVCPPTPPAAPADAHFFQARAWACNQSQGIRMQCMLKRLALTQ